MSGDAPQVAESLDLARARETFEESQDFTIGLEEEFALVDPDSLELAHRFEELRDAAWPTRCWPSPSPAS